MSLGTMHLPPSRHRSYSYWHYTRVSIAENIYVDEDDTLYQQILKAMSPYLRKEPIEDNFLKLDAYPSQSGSNVTVPGLQHQKRERPSRTLGVDQIEKAADIILNNSNSYVEYARNDFLRIIRTFVP